jgi:NADH-quinone oxidoreductase subunit J
MSHPPLVFDGAVAVAILTAVRTVTRVKTPQALLCLTVLVLSMALIFLVLGESFAVAFEVSTYTGAAMLLILCLVLTLNVLSGNAQRTNPWLDLNIWVGPTILTVLLSCQLMLWVGQDSLQTQGLQSFNLQPTGTSLPGPCLLIVEMDLMLSLSALVAACQLGYTKKPLQQLAAGLSLEETVDPAETRVPVAALEEIRS